jgi:hypothetical protein
LRTTLSIDDDLLLAAKAIARERDCSIGEVISDLLRHSLHLPQAGDERNGIPLLSSRPDNPMIDLEMVNALRD